MFNTYLHLSVQDPDKWTFWVPEVSCSFSTFPFRFRSTDFDSCCSSKQTNVTTKLKNTSIGRCWSANRKIDRYGWCHCMCRKQRLENNDIHIKETVIRLSKWIILKCCVEAYTLRFGDHNWCHNKNKLKYTITSLNHRRQ